MDRKDLKTLLEKHGQEHLLFYYDALSEEGKDKLVAQIENVNWKLIDMVHDSKQNQKRGCFEPIAGMNLKQIEVNNSTFPPK